MDDKVLIVQNIGHEGPGLLLDLLREHGIARDLCDLSTGAAMPETRSYGCVVLLGGPQSANDRTPAMAQELQRVCETLKAGIPCIGICLGLQMMVKAAGGAVLPCPVKEVGFREPDGSPYQVTLTPEGRRDPLFRGLPDQLRVFQLHGETVEISADMALLGTGRGCRNQVVRIGERTWGLQCHFELTREMFATWTHLDPDLRSMDRAALLAEFDSIREEYRRTGRTLLLNFLEAAGLIPPGPEGQV
jgi:GMP synthase-like glutamine amidotransferase